MPSIVLNKFSGMIPKLDARNLPQSGSQEALNCDLQGGKISPIQVTGPFQVLHDPDTGKMNGEIPDGNIISITQPDIPVVADRIKLFRPMDWTGSVVSVGMWVTYFDASGNFQTDSYAPTFVPGSNEWEYTDDGIILRAYLNGRSFTAQAGLYYTVHGLNFGFTWQQDQKYFGGPDQVWQFPNGGLATRSDPEFPAFQMPLTAPIDYSGYTNDGDELYGGERYQYGTMQLVSVSAPIPLPNVDMTDESTGTVELTEPGYAEFYFRANYVRNTQVFVNYSTAAVDQRVAEGYLNQAYSGAVTQIDMKDIRYGISDIPASGKIRLVNPSGLTEDVDYSSYGVVNDIYQFTVSTTLANAYLEDSNVKVLDLSVVGKEGPASDISELTAVDPGDLLQLTVPRPTGYNRQVIYRSTTGGDFRALEDELEEDTYIDTFIQNPGVQLPPNGNFPHSTAELAREGSVIIGGHTAFIFDNDEIRPSEPYKQWVYPEEYAFPADAPVLAAVSFASSAVIFTDTNPVTGELGKVYRVSGQNPAYLTRVEITGAKPLLNRRSVCKIDETAYYVTTDGLCAVSPGGVRLITEGLFTRDDWLELSPNLMSAYTADNSIFVIGLDPTNPVNFRFDLGERAATFTTFNAFSDADFKWQSKLFQMPRPWAWRDVQVLADGYPVYITLKGDCGTCEEKILIPDGRARKLPRMAKCRDWEIIVEGRSTVSKVAVATNVQELNR